MQYYLVLAVSLKLAEIEQVITITVLSLFQWAIFSK